MHESERRSGSLLPHSPPMQSACRAATGSRRILAPARSDVRASRPTGCWATGYFVAVPIRSSFRAGLEGPGVDTKENMRASLVHDALYQLMRIEELHTRTHRKISDQLFRDICKEDGVSSITANIFYKALRKFGKPAASPENKKKIHRAPA